MAGSACSDGFGPLRLPVDRQPGELLRPENSSASGSYSRWKYDSPPSFTNISRVRQSGGGRPEAVDTDTDGRARHAEVLTGAAVEPCRDPLGCPARYASGGSNCGQYASNRYRLAASPRVDELASSSAVGGHRVTARRRAIAPAGSPICSFFFAIPCPSPRRMVSPTVAPPADDWSARGSTP